MVYNVHIEFLDAEGIRTGDTTTRGFDSQSAAIRFTREAIRLAEPLNEAMTFNLHHPDGTLLMSCTTKVRRAFSTPTDAANGGGVAEAGA